MEEAFKKHPRLLTLIEVVNTPEEPLRGRRTFRSDAHKDGTDPHVRDEGAIPFPVRHGSQIRPALADFLWDTRISSMR